MAFRRMRGFSMVELAIVLSLILIMTGVTFISLQPALQDARVNSAYDNVLMLLRTARQRSIEERKQYMVCFGVAAPPGALTPLGAPKPTTLQVFRWDAGTALSAAVQISTIDLPFDMQFQTLPGLPANPAKVPDQFGTGTVAIDFDQAVAGRIANQVMFEPDGSAQDVNGNLNNGILYISRNQDLYSTKALTVFGSTGRIRGWRLVNVGGTATWFEQ